MARFRLIRMVEGAALALGLVFLLTGLAGATETNREAIDLKMGGSKIFTAQHTFKRVAIADEKVADLVVLSPRELYVFGKSVGYTSVVLWEEGKSTKTLLDVAVSLDLTGLKEKLQELYPNGYQNIKVHGTETGIVLSGSVSGPEVAEQVIRLAQTYLPKAGSGDRGSEGTGKSGSGITNLLQIDGMQQVMLEVKIAEVTREKGKDWSAGLGLNKLSKEFKMSAGVGKLGVSSTGTLASQNPGTLLLNFAGNAANVFVNIDEFTAALEILEEEGLARTLAEPRLVTQSGQEASFLAGGEFPIPVAQSSSSTSGGSTITIEFKEFGVGLVFTPVVLSDGRISLRVAPSVTELSDIGAFTLSSGSDSPSFTIPGLTTRKLESTVQLYDGQSLAIAGLLQDTMRNNVSKIPGLGDLPILGPLFRSTSYLQNKTELLIAVTPHLVAPVKEGSITFPGEKIQPPNWYEFYLEGVLEGRRYGSDPSQMSQHKLAFSPDEKSGGLEGNFGYLPLSAR